MKIQNKLFLVIFSFSLLLVTALVLLIQWSINRGIVDYVNSKEVETLKPLVTQLVNEYKKHNSWDMLQNNHQKFGDLLFLTLQDDITELSRTFKNRLPQEKNDRPPRMERRPPPHNEIFALLDKNKNLIAGHYLEYADYNQTSLEINNVNIGWLVSPKYKHITDGYELDFIKQQQSYLGLIALVAMLMVGLITLPLARHLAEPIKKIILGMHKLTQGDYEQHIKLDRKDELGDLGRDFNALAITLHENESARKRWLANISHELRTPVAILRGELEAMLDDVRPLSKNNIESANDEVKHLQCLIDDLHQLTSAEIGGMHYRKERVNISKWLNSEADKYASYLSVSNTGLVIDIKSTEVNILADLTRLCQLFENLINNCIKYAEASLMTISLNIEHGYVCINVEDNGIGVKEPHLTHLFEYLYRVDNSRNRETGGAGLGLSICEHIVSAHQGGIEAAASRLGGLAIIIRLPIEQQQ